MTCPKCRIHLVPDLRRHRKSWRALKCLLCDSRFWRLGSSNTIEVDEGLDPNVPYDLAVRRAAK